MMMMNESKEISAPFAGRNVKNSPSSGWDKKVSEGTDAACWSVGIIIHSLWRKWTSSGEFISVIVASGHNDTSRA